jgi:bile acid:Na+ symporter, BASS family
MSTQDLVSIFIPMILAIMMMGLGLNLQLIDFARVKHEPKPVFLGLAIQIFVLPVFAFLLTIIFRLPPPYCIGLMLLAASPGGPSANLFSYLAGGDVALNITLTAINSVLSIVTIPLVIEFSYAHFMAADKEIPLQFAKLLQVVGVILIPLLIGIWLRHKRPDWAAKSVKPMKRLSIIFLALLAAYGIYNEAATIRQALKSLASVIFVFSTGSIIIAYLISRSMKIGQRQVIAITIEVGLHNCAIAMAIAMSPYLLNSMDIAMPAIFYAITMQFTIGLTAYLFSRRSKLLEQRNINEKASA